MNVHLDARSCNSRLNPAIVHAAAIISAAASGACAWPVLIAVGAALLLGFRGQDAEEWTGSVSLSAHHPPATATFTRDIFKVRRIPPGSRHPRQMTAETAAKPPAVSPPGGSFECTPARDARRYASPAGLP